MTVKFIIPYPESRKERVRWSREYGLNAIYAGKHWRKRNADKEFWHTLVRSELRRQRVPLVQFGTPVVVTFSWADGLDCDNHAYMGKMILDSLSGYLIRDDDRRYVQEVTHRFHREDYILVELEEYSKKGSSGPS